MAKKTACQYSTLQWAVYHADQTLAHSISGWLWSGSQNKHVELIGEVLTDQCSPYCPTVRALVRRNDITI